MSALHIRQVGCIIFSIFIFLNMAEAKDLAILQSAVTYAREDMEKAKVKHEDNKRVATQQKRIVDERKKQLADESKRLDKAQQDVILSEKQYLDAQKKYQKAQSTLDQAWNKK